MGNYDIEKQNAKYKYRSRSFKKKNRLNSNKEDEDITTHKHNKKHSSDFYQESGWEGNDTKRYKKMHANFSEYDSCNGDGFGCYSGNKKLIELLTMFINLEVNRHRDSVHRDLESSTNKSEKSFTNFVLIIVGIIAITLMFFIYWIAQYNIEEIKSMSIKNAAIISSFKEAPISTSSKDIATTNIITKDGI